MKDNQKKYLDKVVEILVSGTIIDYDGRNFQPPYTSTLSPLNFKPFPLYVLDFSRSERFKENCKNTYGLGNDEIKYVWEQYRGYIKYLISQAKNDL
jgi:hypothetical protein